MTFMEIISQTMFDFTSPLYISGVIVCTIIVSVILKCGFKRNWLPREQDEFYLFLACLGSWPSVAYITVAYALITLVFFVYEKMTAKNKKDESK